MSDCLLALERCSLIGLDDSPQLLRRSMLYSANASTADSTAPQQLNFAEDQGAQQMQQRPPAAGTGGRILAAAVTAQAGAGPATWLDCSLPLLASESPAIAGTKPPRSRFRRAAAAPAAGKPAADMNASAAAGQQAAGHGDVEAAAAAADPPAQAAAEASCGFAAKECMPLGSYARGASDTDSQADCNPHPETQTAAPTESAAAAAASQPKQQEANWDLLQQLLDDSSCSSLSCLPPVMAQQQAPTTPAATPAAAAAAGQGMHSSAWQSPDAAGARELTRSVGSDITGFRGFWSATPGAESQAAFSPAPMGHPPTGTPHQQDGCARQSPYSYASMQAAAGEDADADAAAGVNEGADAQAAQQRNTALMMLLSLEDSAVLGRASCAEAGSEDAAGEAQQRHSSPIPEGEPGAEQGSPTGSEALHAAAALEAAAAEAAGIASPDAVRGGQLLRQQDWAAVGMIGQGAASSFRYTADCWPSPDGSPGVLLSSPVLHESDGMQAASTAPKTASRFAPAAAATPAKALGAQQQDAAVGNMGAVSVAAAIADDGSRASALRAVQQRNALEFSPIRGLTLWGDASIPDAAQHLAAAATAAADSPTWGSKGPHHHQQQQQQDDSVGAGSASSAAGIAAADQFEQLQRLLTSSSSSSDDWQDASPICATEQQHLQQSPTGAHEQLTSLQLLQMSTDLASSVASRLQERSPGLRVCVGGDGLAAPAEQLGGGGTGSGSPAFYTPADTPQTEQTAMLMFQAPLPSAEQQQLQPEGQQEQSADGSGSPAHSPAASRTAAAAMAPAGSGIPADTPLSAQGKLSPLRVRTMPGEDAPESPHGAAAKSPMEAAAAAAAAGGSSAGTPVSARGRTSPLHLRASPAESVDSFYGAAAGEPYSSMAFESSAARQQDGDSVRRSISWQAFDGLGSLLDAEHPPTPGSVACKKAWAPSGGSILAGSAGNSRASSSGGSAANAAAAAPAQRRIADAAAQPTGHGAAGPVGAQGVAAGVEGKVEAAVDTAADLASLVSLLKQQLRQVELKCTQQQLSVNEARQLVLQKELEVKRLRAGLAQSEQEGNGCLEALDAALDIMTVTGTAPEPPNGQPSVADGADDDSGSGSMSAEDSMQLQQQYQALQEHNAELQSTLAEAGQQLDFFEAQLQQLTAEKAAVEQQLASMQELLDRRQAEHEAFLQSELDEQQQQHEEEVGQLHEQLQELRDQLEALRDAAAASKTAAEQSQAKASSLQQQLVASEEHTQVLSQQLEQLQAVLRRQESESAASSEQLSRQVAQLLAAQQELQQANARLLEAEAEYASNQLALGCRNQELSKQLQDVAASNKRLDEANQQLQAQNASLSQMVQSLRANNAAHATSAVSASVGAATPTSTAQNRPPGPGASGMEGPTPMRRRMASVNAQLERRVQELLQQKQALAAQVEQLQQQLGQQPPADAAGGLSEQQQAAFDELQQQVEHLTTCNDELVQQLEELDWAHEQLQAEKLDLQGRLSDLEQDRVQLLGQLQVQEQAEAASTAAADAAGSEHDALAHALQVQVLQQDRDRLSAECQQLQGRLAQALQQLVQLQEQQDLSQNNTALFERCKELEAQVQHLQQQLQQRDAQAMRASSDAGSMRAAGQQELQGLRQELQQLEQQQAAQQEVHAQQQEQLLDRCQTLSADLTAARQQLQDLQQQLDQAQGSKDQLAAECGRLERAAADAEASSQAAQEALHSLRDRNKSLVDQLVQMQLAGPGTPPAAKASWGVATAERAAQTAPGNSADVAAATEQQQRKRRWTLEAGVQVELGSTDAEQATAVQQLLLLQAQAQLHEMEEQNRQAAQRHVDAKQRIAQLQGSLTQQEAALQAAEQQLREAKQQHGRESGGLQRENDQLVRQLADSRVKLQVLQTANTHLEGRVAQQQRDLHLHATAAKEAQLKLQELTHQQHLGKLQVSAVNAELSACKDHTQQLVAAQEKEARAAAALQQKLQQAQQEGHKAAAAAVATSRAAYDALEERLGREVQTSREQVEQLAREKNTLMVELQQTKATVDCLEDSVRRLGQHNAHLVQQIKGAFTAADSGGTGVTAALAAAAGRAAAMHTPTSGFTSAGGASGSSCAGGGSSMSGAVGQQGMGAAAALAVGAAGPVSPRTLHSIIAAATRVNEKNKKLKRQLQLAMQQGQQAA